MTHIGTLSRHLVGRVHTDSQWYQGNATLADMRRLLDNPPHDDEYNGAEVITSLRLPLRLHERYGGGELQWGTEGKDTIEAPAGRFDNCIAVREEGNMWNSPINWTCPGVGIVRDERGGCQSMGGGFALYELLDYYIPQITPVP